MPISDDLIFATLSPHINVALDSSKQRKKKFALTKQPHAVIGGYALDKVLGKGKCGEVRLAWLPTSNMPFAIKLLKKSSMDEAMLSRLARELSVLNELDHPHIVRISEIVVDSHYVGLVMDCAQGGDLFKHLSQHGRVSEEQARAWFAQLVWAIDSVHTSSFAHRDIKPENLLIDDQNHLVVTDFEMCESFRRCGFPYMSDPCGSPTYCPPEAMLSPHAFDVCKGDVWAMGITLYAMTAGYLPFEDHLYYGVTNEEVMKLYLHINESPLQVPDTFSPELTDLLHGLLAKDPAHRLTLADVKRHPWIEAHQHLWSCPPLSEHRSASTHRSTRFGSWSSSISSLQTLNDSMVQCKKQIRVPIIWDPSAGYELPR